MSRSFWDQRFASAEYAYGTEPAPFVRWFAERLDSAASIVELGAGEGRNAVWLAEQGFPVTLVDFSNEGLDKARRLATKQGVTISCVQADVTAWQPERTWDAALVTYLHLFEKDRAAFYGLLKRLLVPGGLLAAEWFRPEQITDGYESGGPPRVDLMVTADELREHFPADGIRFLEERVHELHEGPYHIGPAAVVQLLWRKSITNETTS